MDDHKPPFGLVDAAVRILDVHTTQDALATPASRSLLDGRPGFFQQDGEQRLLLPPGLQLLPYHTRARDTCHQTKVLLQTESQRPLTLGFAVRHKAPYPWQPQGETFFNGERGLRTIAGIPIA
jgi:hypothetical protein